MVSALFTRHSWLCSAGSRSPLSADGTSPRSSYEAYIRCGECEAKVPTHPAEATGDSRTSVKTNTNVEHLAANDSIPSFRAPTCRSLCIRRERRKPCCEISQHASVPEHTSRTWLTTDTDGAHIQAAAETVSRAFDDDPLLQFLYANPKQQTWGRLERNTQLWQQNRLRKYQLDGEIIEAQVKGENAGICILHPPKSWKHYLRWRWLLAYLKATILRICSPGKEECCDPKVRVPDYSS